MKNILFALIWEIFGFMWVSLFLYFWTGKLVEATGVSLIICFIKIIGLAIYKKIWEKIK